MQERFETHVAISDIHGHAWELIELHMKLKQKYGTYFTHYLGDYVDRGEESVLTLGIVMSSVEAGVASALLGNHDYKLLRYLKNKIKGEPSTVQIDEAFRATVEEVDKLTDDEHLKMFLFLDSLPVYEEYKDKKLVHAHYSQSRRDLILRKKTTFLYGITDTRNLDDRGLPTRIPWWETYDGRYGEVVYGHYHAGDVIKYPHATCIDTDVCGTKRLAAYNLDTGEVTYN